MCLAGGTGVTIKLPAGTAAPHAYLYGEDQGRYLVATDDGDALVEPRPEAPASRPSLLGYCRRPDTRRRGPRSACRWQELRAVHEAWLPDYMNSAA